MSLITSNATTTQSNFSIRNPITPYVPNRAHPLQSGVAIKDDQGPLTIAIQPTAVLGHTIVVSPLTTGQVYTLPTAAALLYEFGRSIDTGIPKTAKGNMLVFNVVNRGNFAATLQSNPTGGDGTVVSCGTGAVGSGTQGQTGKITIVYLEWLAVSGGLNGATGQYTLYSN